MKDCKTHLKLVWYSQVPVVVTNGIFSLWNIDMRKALSRDKDQKSIVPLKDPVRPEDIE